MQSIIKSQTDGAGWCFRRNYWKFKAEEKFRMSISFVLAILFVSKSRLLTDEVRTSRQMLKRMFVISVSCIAGVAHSGQGTIAPFAHMQECEWCPEMIVLPPGTYEMGATEEEFRGKDKYKFLYIDETPRHAVTVKSFALAKFNVTREQFGAFAKETGFHGKGCRIFNGKNWMLDPNADWKNPGFEQSNRDPVVCISWDDSQKFIAWFNSKLPKNSMQKYRLPTEEEWEYAARAGTVTATYWGNNIQDQCRYENTRDLSAKFLDSSVPYANCDDGFVYTAPVGSFKSNPWGLFDMLGNAAQWVGDCANTGYQNLSARDETNSDSCQVRTLRGASWSSVPIGVRSAARSGMISSIRESIFGFRLAVDISK